MLAVHFGAGNIGRGFIGSLLYQAGFYTVFVDINEEIIKELNKERQYKVILAADEKECVQVKNVSGINSIKEPDRVISKIIDADIITTAVGINVIPQLGELIAKGLIKRMTQNHKPLNIIACENAIGGSTQLKENILRYIPAEKMELFKRIYGFPDAAVDRIVPNQTNPALLDVVVEEYYEWIIDKTMVVGKQPPIWNIIYVNDLKPYIERKLFTVNTGHVVPAYLGQFLGYNTIEEAMKDSLVQETILGALRESGEALIRKYQFNRQAHEKYIRNIIKRFNNKYISDEVNRVGRSPIRKLSRNDRLVRPSILYMEAVGKPPKYLAKTIAAALTYKNADDDETIQLQKMVLELGYERTLKKIANLPQEHSLIKMVLEELRNLKELEKFFSECKVV
ncbi:MULTISPECIES: mannitol-1-phosphate 5-dehydrogenase [Clostridia]|uniref:mannitol-1-phosphate 5-dehydrogenase n=1 Tax=Clostridia TaxID=186801 RepID=UPI000EA2177A|nr:MULTISPECIES: mannitol-1-phosphate 5-dehydrogenase [Clostridia]NBJ70823.1 mannitol-1-phosphate 5-dehydrogenase [Roseburia sp. 1XD42-34]RKI75687.1 mannitol-1-phosphate 5-dehydrogenase [Clostridium sp. 1xD42-85]